MDVSEISIQATSFHALPVHLAHYGYNNNNSNAISLCCRIDSWHLPQRHEHRCPDYDVFFLFLVVSPLAT